MKKLIRFIMTKYHIENTEKFFERLKLALKQKNYIVL